MSPYALEESDNVAEVNFIELDRLVKMLSLNKFHYLIGVQPPEELFWNCTFIM